jgi:hypothetical protein
MERPYDMTSQTVSRRRLCFPDALFLAGRLCTRAAVHVAGHVLDGFASRQIGHPIAQAYIADPVNVEFGARQDGVNRASGGVIAEVGRLGLDVGQISRERLVQRTRF